MKNILISTIIFLVLACGLIFIMKNEAQRDFDNEENEKHTSLKIAVNKKLHELQNRLHEIKVEDENIKNEIHSIIIEINDLEQKINYEQTP